MVYQNFHARQVGSADSQLMQSRSLPGVYEAPKIPSAKISCSKKPCTKHPVTALDNFFCRNTSFLKKQDRIRPMIALSRTDNFGRCRLVY